MNTGIPALLALALLSTVGCAHTRYSEYDASTGKKTRHFSTRANIGYTTDYVEGANSKISGNIPFLGGGYDNKFITKSTVAPSEGEQVGLQIGGQDGLSIYGVIDHATVTDREGHWFHRGLRTVATFLGIFKIADVWGNTENAKTTAGVDTIGLNNKVRINDSDNALGALKDNNATKVKLEALAE